MPMVVAISENGGLILVAWIYCIHDLSLLNLLIALRFEQRDREKEREFDVSLIFDVQRPNQKEMNESCYYHLKLE
ncbi:hypothetical protein L2E82_05890 [Cichorium intybus]|uniref:Uncharacterized protein n=1 Tax=Cichorium intybus TaxID=13427 RepID=A0ACB9H930_CICIN|nr:hypothetical protein L2E82_05890 [Cichorium intybus]